MNTSQKITRTYHPLVRGLQFIYTAIIWLFVMGIGIQVYFASLSIFLNASWLEAHTALGWPLALSVLPMLLLVALARFPRHIILLNVLLFLLVFLQVAFVTWIYAFEAPALVALHPVNALLLFLASVITAFKAVQWIRATGVTREKTSSPGENDRADTDSGSAPAQQATR